MAKLFASHASADKPVVRRIVEAVRQAGHTVWIDEEGILIGESIPDAVWRALKDVDFVILCLSTEAIKSGWVKAELDTSLMKQLKAKHVRILPVRLADVPPPEELLDRLYVDLFPEEAFERGLKKLLQSIDHHEAQQHGLPRRP